MSERLLYPLRQSMHGRSPSTTFACLPDGGKGEFIVAESVRLRRGLGFGTSSLLARVRKLHEFLSL